MASRAPRSSSSPDPPPRPRVVTGVGRVLGVDPGLNITGYAILEREPSGPVVIEAGVIRPSLHAKALECRLRLLHEGLLELFDEFHPTSMAVEQVHSHVAHPRTAILMAHARGVIMLAAALRDVSVCGYAPTRIKKTLTGSGRAPKEQVQYAIQAELGLESLPEPNDVADACAVALCHLHLNHLLRDLIR